MHSQGGVNILVLAPVRVAELVGGAHDEVVLHITQVLGLAELEDALQQGRAGRRLDDSELHRQCCRLAAHRRTQPCPSPTRLVVRRVLAHADVGQVAQTDHLVVRVLGPAKHGVAGDGCRSAGQGHAAWAGSRSAAVQEQTAGPQPRQRRVSARAHSTAQTHGSRRRRSR